MRQQFTSLQSFLFSSDEAEIKVEYRAKRAQATHRSMQKRSSDNMESDEEATPSGSDSLPDSPEQLESLVTQAVLERLGV